MGSDEQPAHVTTDAVAGLAREVEGLRRRVETLAGVTGRVEDLARVVTELAERVAVTAIRPGPAVTPVSWLDLPADLELAQQILADLVGWLGDVYLRYSDAVVSFPDCWLWHPDVVEELLWLMGTWQTAYQGETATVALAGDWHDRYRPGVVRRLKQVVGTCSVDNHVPRNDRPGGARPVVPLAEAMAPLAAWWAQQRVDAPPEPTPDHLTRTNGRRARSPGR
jgi:hypothetical protein